MNISDDQLATALIAKMAGTDLKRVDDYTLTQSSTGPATRIDPKKFLSIPGLTQPSPPQINIEEVNKQAEALFPLPQQIANTPTPETDNQQQLTFDFLNENTKNILLTKLDSVINYLYSINSKLDKLTTKSAKT